MKIKIFFFGKKNEITKTEKELLRRINFKINTTFIILPQAGIKDSDQIKKKEADLFFQKTKDSDFILAFDERGEEYDSFEFSTMVKNTLENKKEISFIIGGAYGLSEKILKRANLVIRCGKMVWTRNLFRTMVCEQLYRALEIAAGSNFHK